MSIPPLKQHVFSPKQNSVCNWFLNYKSLKTGETTDVSMENCNGWLYIESIFRPSINQKVCYHQQYVQPTVRKAFEEKNKYTKRFYWSLQWWAAIKVS